MSKKKPRGRAKDRVTIAWDMGASGRANRIGLVVEERGETDAATGKRINPNGIKGVRRVDTLALYHSRGVISTRGYNAGERLRTAWLDTMRSPGWLDNDRVQSSPKPDQAIAMQVGRISRLLWLSRRVPADCVAIVKHIAMNDGSVSGIRIRGNRPFLGRNAEKGRDEVRIAFDKLADAFER